MANITDLTLAELVNKVKKKDVSSKEITAAYVSRSEKSKKLNAYITEDFENVLKKADNFDKNPDFKKKLHGIKIDVKDNNVEQAIRVLKRKLQKDGFFKVIKMKSTYEKPSERKKRVQTENIKRIKKLQKLKNRY